MWNKDKEEPEKYDKYLYEYIPNNNKKENVFPTYEEFIDIIKYLPNWKAAGCDGIYNYFIKKSITLHPYIYKLLKKTCLEGNRAEKWFYKGITYLIPKGEPTKGSDFRPITCMSNLYKLTTKCVTKILQNTVEKRGLLTENQLGTARRVQGAKEQAMINIALNKANKHKLKTAWIDVKKAFDSIRYNYLLECIKNMNLPDWIENFLTNIIKEWSLSIRYNNEEVLNKKVSKRIIQGDSLSPLLFVMCMDPLSKKLNGQYPKAEIMLENKTYTCNHLLFIDDLKIMSETEKKLKEMLQETEDFFKEVGLERNKRKSATNTRECEDKAIVLDVAEGYKYLGITENRENKVTQETLENIKKLIMKRVEKLCKTKLNGKNIIRAINEYALSVVNYYIGVIPISPIDLQKIDDEVRKILIVNRVHLQPACKERLYLARNELGRGLSRIEHKGERMQLEMLRKLEDNKERCIRKAAILETLQNELETISYYDTYLQEKYKTNIKITKEILIKVQKESLYSNIETKTRHQKLYDARKNEQVDIEGSSIWLKNGNNRPQDEARLCYIQDRNLFGKKVGKCPHCKEKFKTVDHLATQCERMLYHDYMRRHNEIVRCIHLLLCNKYGIIKNKRIRSHSVQETVSNQEVTINVDTRAYTNIKIQANKPDIIVFDKRNKQITIIEVGITSQNQLKTVEVEKRRKYEILANHLGQIHKMKARIIPWVMTWDGIVTKHHKYYLKEIGINKTIEAYMQTLTIKKTLESISMEYKSGEEDNFKAEQISLVITKEEESREKKEKSSAKVS